MESYAYTRLTKLAARKSQVEKYFKDGGKKKVPALNVVKFVVSKFRSEKPEPKKSTKKSGTSTSDSAKKSGKKSAKKE